MGKYVARFSKAKLLQKYHDKNNSRRKTGASGWGATSRLEAFCYAAFTSTKTHQDILYAGGGLFRT